MRGTTYALGPAGAQFAAPVTVIIRYDPAALPRWVVPGDLVLQRWDGTRWSRLTNLVVDPVARTVRGRTPGFSTVGVYFLNPQVTLNPSPAQVNSNQRSVVLSAEVTGEGRLPDALQFEWTGTGSNGSFTGQSGNTIQYTALTPILPAGDIDGVGVVVRGQFDPNGPFEVIGQAQTTVRSNLDLAYQLQPTRTLVQYGGAAPFAALVVDRNGNQAYHHSGFLRYEWSSTTSAGSLSPGPARTATSTATYTAYPPSQQSAVRPKGDKVTVKFFLVTYTRTPFLLGGGFKLDSTMTELGAAEAFVQVIPRYQVRLMPGSSQLQAGQSVGLQAVLEPAWQEDEQLFFEWRNTGSQGTLSVSQGVPLSQNAVTYSASANPSGGTDYVDVVALAGFLGQVGTARASVSVEARKTMIQGSFVVAAPVALDPGRQCVAAYVVFPLVAGATSYEMHAHGFNDTATGRTEIMETFYEPVPAFRACSVAGWGVNGSDGTSVRYLLTGLAGPSSGIAAAISSFNARFAGMKVDVTVRY